MKILTTGDGDLSFSLSLKRAYPQHLQITASTLLESREELVRTYSNAAEILQELKDVWKDGAEVLYAVDCCKLEAAMSRDVVQKSNQFDLIMFNHPHLGDATLYESEAHHAKRHYALLCHYFHSATTLRHSGFLSPNGRVHVCLCGTQPKTWDLMKAARRNGWKCVLQEGTASPVHQWLFGKNLGQKQSQDAREVNMKEVSPDIDKLKEIVPVEVQAHYPCPRKYRNGKLGSKHFLGRYGYRHRRTGGDLYGGNDTDMAVHQSINFIFEFVDGVMGICSDEIDSSGEQSIQGLQGYFCSVCEQSFSSEAALHAHLEAPALPDIQTGDFLHAKEKKDSSDYSAQDVNGSKTEQTPTKDEKITLRKQVPAFKSSETREKPQDGALEEDMKLAETIVPEQYASKRLKWLCRQDDFHPFSQHIRSKKQCIDAIRDGRIYVNGSVAQDSGRIVKEGDVLVLLRKVRDATSSHGQGGTDEGSCLEPPLSFGVEVKKILSISKGDDELTKFIVAYKPVGIRAVGQFSDRTLESITKSILMKDRTFISTSNLSSSSISCTSLTKLDTGCAGLCLLVANVEDPCDTFAKPNSIPAVKVTYHFTALIHGHVPQEWDHGVYVKLSGTGSRRWKRQKVDSLEENTEASNEMEEVEHDIHTTNVSQDSNDSLFIQCIDRYEDEPTRTLKEGNNNPTRLSTVIVRSSRDAGRLSNVICFHLRKLRYPVVNDRFCKREYASLPRIMRNIIKNRLCLGCYGFGLQIIENHQNIKLDGLECSKQHMNMSMDPHPRTQCSFWRQTTSGSSSP